MQTLKFPQSRVATLDIAPFAIQKNHVAALLEVDVTDCRERIRALRKNGVAVSLHAVLLKTIAATLMDFPHVAAFLQSSRKIAFADHITISTMVEKDVNGAKVPIPILLNNADAMTCSEITAQIADARKAQLNEQSFTLDKKQQLNERLYALLPGFLRRFVWRLMLASPNFMYKNMGNVIVTAVGMMGKVNGWFVHKSIHPISFGMGSVLVKPQVMGEQIVPREMMHMTVLLDHNVVDGAPMARFISELCKNITTAKFVEA